MLPAEVLDAFDADAFAAAWHQSLTSPPDARNRVLVALERNTVRGFAVTGPSPDPDADPVADGEISELVVDPDHDRGRSRLAAAPRLRRHAAGRPVHPGDLVWLEHRRRRAPRFLTGAGWAPDGAHRELDLHGDGSVRVKQVRLHTDLTEG